MHVNDIDMKLRIGITTELDNLKTQAEAIEAEWNGDEPGELEDRANAAHDILFAIKLINESLDTLL